MENAENGILNVCPKCGTETCQCVKSFHLVKRRDHPQFETHESWLLLALFLLETMVFTAT
ncbi:MAG: hypothetical protein UR94_C0012G0010 [Parcubacteria group bacterium GW2011_GWA2_36_10]|nr:MAG: hypothetical protein UR94_C0012G0010 [Parcubacteria group bacterium GW2011_GWA2_36_10]